MPEPGMGGNNDHGGGGNGGGGGGYGGDNDFGGFDGGGGGNGGGGGGYGSDGERDFESSQGQFGGQGGNEPGGADRFGVDNGPGGGGEDPAPAGPRLAIAPAPAKKAVVDTNYDLFNKRYDPNKFYGPPEARNEKAIAEAASGFLTHNRGVFGLREKLVDDPTEPGKVKAEIQFDPIGFIADLVETVVGFALGGPIGAVVATVAGRGVQLAADPSYSVGQAFYDATNPFGIRDEVEDPTSPFAGLGRGVANYPDTTGNGREGNPPDPVYGGNPLPASYGGAGAAFAPTPAAGGAPASIGAPAAAGGGNAAAPAPAGVELFQPGAAGARNWLPEIIAAGALLYSVST